MVKLEVLEAKANLNVNKNTFTKGETYWSRLSKDGNQVLVMSNEGNWISFKNRTYAKQGKPELYFNKIHYVLPKNYSQMRYITTYLKPKEVEHLWS